MLGPKKLYVVDIRWYEALLYFFGGMNRGFWYFWTKMQLTVMYRKNFYDFDEKEFISA